MMIVQMDKMSTPSSREMAQRLYDKNKELESRRRMSAQTRVPSDPNAWQQMRENYETIILEDHEFSEQHNIEYALWQLHYRRIEEFRTHFSSALASSGSNPSQGVKAPPRPDRASKIRLQFKTFLSEATGFYHDLILKIRSKYGLPLGFFSEDSENRNVMENDGKRFIEMKKGLISCHRCLIYLGDLARYKGLYGEGDSKNRDFAAALSYYLQAASLCPSSGNPHHQLAILAAYSGDELVVVYRYFRSLAVDSPFSTARDNLIVAFEKNRQSYSQLHGDRKPSATSESLTQITAKGRGKTEAKIQPKDGNVGIHDTLKTFCTCFVRLNGILFTRTSLETFADVLSMVSSLFDELLSSGPVEALNFGTDAVKNGLLVVRLISILIFTVNNLNRDSEGQTYADIVQRKILLDNAYTTVFQLVGHMLKRCMELHDPCSSYLLPGILVFVEWLACSPDIAVGSNIDDKEATARSLFWSYCISFLNKLLSSGLVVTDDEDETCFFNMTKYEEGETESRLALWEDFELRGFLPLQPAQAILDFSKKNSIGGDGKKEKTARVKRILAAGKALANVVKVDQEIVTFDLKAKKFVLGAKPQTLDDKPQISDDVTLVPVVPGPKLNGVNRLHPTEETENTFSVLPNEQLYVEGEEEDEVIVFKPTVTEKQSDLTVSNWMPHEGLDIEKVASAGASQFIGVSVPAHHVDPFLRTMSAASSQPPASVRNHVLQHLHPIQSHSSTWLDQQASLANGLKDLSVFENGHVIREDLSPSYHTSLPVPQFVNVNPSGISYGQTRASDMLFQSKIDSVASSGSVGVTTNSTLPAGSRRNPVSRPVRHLGPPPGFSSAPPKPMNEPISGSDLVAGNVLMDDYSWLDGYKMPLEMKGLGMNQSHRHPSQASLHHNSNNSGSFGTYSFPFPGRQVPAKQLPVEKQKDWEDNPTSGHLRLNDEQLQLQQLIKGSQQYISRPEQYQGQSIWGGRHPV